ncbi:ENT-like protein [Dioscorea alata]|uniref:ENT-like protein n=1 Tax=Dioscorea alata TaxID=55571 RepID=A0ACB7TYZ9_DIOAL|nr:ENT-like protein [Dioscorea alata]
MRIAPGSSSYDADFTDFESKIHLLETVAYDAVLRAFRVQADDLSWSKESLLTDLRKELRISDANHREILGQINNDQSIKSLRNWHKAKCFQQPKTENHPCIDVNSKVRVSRKKLKPSNVTSPSLQHLPSLQPSQTNCRDGIFSPQVGIARPMVHLAQNRQASNASRGKGSMVVSVSRNGLMQSGNENLKAGSDIIQIRSTDELLFEVQKICGSDNPDLKRLQQAKHMLREHEKALMDAIEKIAYVPDRGESTEEPDHDIGHWQVERVTQSASGNAAGHGIPCIDLQDSEYD